MTETLLDVRDLTVVYRGRRGGVAVALDGVSLSIGRGETLGVLGRSGSGKSTLGNVVLGLVSPTAGRIWFDGADITARRTRSLSRRIQAVFQDPYGSLNPSRTVGHTLSAPLRIVDGLSRGAADVRVAEALHQVGLTADAATRYPRAFSGGQRQRVALARALARRPDLIVCDEPTSALDLSVQAQIVDLLLDLQDRHRLSYLFISHDVDLVRELAHQVITLPAGAA